MDHAKKNVRMIPRKEGKEREGRLAERQGGLEGGREGARKRGIQVNHFSTTGRNCGTPLRDACVRQACLPAIATSSFKIFLTQSFPRRGATCYIAFKGDVTAFQWCQ